MNLLRLEQALHLVTPLEETGAEVNVEDVENPQRRLQIRSNTTSPLSMSPTEIHIARSDNRPAAEKRIAIRAPQVMPRAAENGLQSERVSERLHLTLTPITGREDFLQCDDVRIDLSEHIPNALYRYATIHATTLVDVVRHNPH